MLAVPFVLWFGVIAAGQFEDEGCFEVPAAMYEDATVDQDFRWLPPRTICRVTRDGVTTTHVDHHAYLYLFTGLFLLFAALALAPLTWRPRSVGARAGIALAATLLVLAIAFGLIG